MKIFFGVLLGCFGLFWGNAQPITGIWRGTVTKGNGVFAHSSKLEIKLIKNGDSLVGTSYFFINAKTYIRHSIRGYFDARQGTIHWADFHFIERKPVLTSTIGQSTVPMVSTADFSCPDGKTMKLDGFSNIGDEAHYDLHLEKLNTGKTLFPDEWDNVVEGYFTGTNDPHIIDSVWVISFKPKPGQPDDVAKNTPPTPPEPPIVAKVEVPLPKEKEKPIPPPVPEPPKVEPAPVVVKKAAVDTLPIAKVEPPKPTPPPPPIPEQAKVEPAPVVAKKEAIDTLPMAKVDPPKPAPKPEPVAVVPKVDILKSKSSDTASLAKTIAIAPKPAPKPVVISKKDTVVVAKNTLPPPKPVPEKPVTAKPVAKPVVVAAAKKPLPPPPAAPKPPVVVAKASPTMQKQPAETPAPAKKTTQPVAIKPIAIPEKIDPLAVEKFNTRKKIQQAEIPMVSDTMELNFYDNAEVDGDSISLFVKGRLLFNHVLLTAQAYTFKLPIKDLPNNSELAMVAENLGTIPPNTSYMMAIVNGERYSARLESTESSSGVIKLVRRE